MKKCSLKKKEQEENIRKLAISSEYRGIENVFIRAFTIYVNHIQDNTFSSKTFCNYFKLNRNKVELDLWRFLLHYDEKLYTKTPYLPLYLEEELYKMVIKREDEKNAMNEDEIIEEVNSFF